MVNIYSINNHSIPSNEMNQQLTELYSSVMPSLAKCIPDLNAQRSENFICLPCTGKTIVETIIKISNILQSLIEDLC